MNPLAEPSPRTLRELRQRLSLREPQQTSLERMAALVEALDLHAEAAPRPLADDLATVQAMYPEVSDFERDFPNLCFALATGVGKTRLMGAMIAWLTITGRSRNFFVLAPNLTIYEKLKTDFSHGSDKYVFAGLRQFVARPPVVVTGETWETGQGVRRDGGLLGDDPIPYINIFNVGKINQAGIGEDRDGKPRRMHRLHEYVGESYFEYLSGLKDLVLFMDEAHRYRASAAMTALNELKPMLGIELTATPKTTGAKPKDFKNIVYSYPLAHALRDGFVKEPAVATRADFDPKNVSAEQLDRIKLEDGIHCHEEVKLQLELHARETGTEPVHPFMLVVARDTAHASEINAIIASSEFFDGRYADAVIEIHSKKTGQESEDAIARLSAVQQDRSTEIVIHVNKLKEGWDVNNLYTIVPLRASDSEILTEQTIGRGLRLPYGRRTGNPAVDRLTIVAHDQFEKIIARANQDDSIIREQRLVGPGGDVPNTGGRLLRVPSTIEAKVNGQSATIDGQQWAGVSEPEGAVYIVNQAELARAALAAIHEQTRLPSSGELSKPEVVAMLTDRVLETTRPQQADIAEVEDPVAREAEARQVVEAVVQSYQAETIDIPNIVLMPDGKVHYGFNDFDLVNVERINVQPVSQAMLIEELSTRQRSRLETAHAGIREQRPEDYLVRQLVSHDDVDYEAYAKLLYKLARQVIDQLRRYLADEDQVDNAANFHCKQLADFIWQQMRENKWHSPVEYTANVLEGFTPLDAPHFPLSYNQQAQDLLSTVAEPAQVKRLIFGGFQRCCYPLQKFDSVEGEVSFARIVDRDSDVLRWMKPASQQFRIHLPHGRCYEPDFVVECQDYKLLVETKQRSKLQEGDVQEKASAAARWCADATAHGKAYGGKPWQLLLIPHDALQDRHTVAGLVAAYAWVAQ